MEIHIASCSCEGDNSRYLELTAPDNMSTASTTDTDETMQIGLIHLAAIPDPMHHDWRIVHNNNVTSSYNVLYTAAIKRGIKRISQASSINATGMSYTREGKQVVDELPITEQETFRGVS